MELDITRAACTTHATQAASWSIPTSPDVLGLECNGWTLLELIKAYERNSWQTILCPCEFLNHIRFDSAPENLQEFDGILWSRLTRNLNKQRPIGGHSLTLWPHRIWSVEEDLKIGGAPSSVLLPAILSEHLARSNCIFLFSSSVSPLFFIDLIAIKSGIDVVC